MHENKNIRDDIIKYLEKKLNCKIIVYFTGDRHPLGARIAEDAVRPLYDHLLGLRFDKGKKIITLFLYSRGGDVSVPWRIVSMIREFCDEFNVLIPYKAQSAATLLSLGADNIIMGKKGELGPIDPSLFKVATGESSLPPQEIAVEDVNSFISFIKEKANINDQEPLAKIVSQLANQVSPITLGSINRQNSHIRLVARKLITSRKIKIDEEKIGAIIETLTEKIYSHGHGIGRKEASEIGLPVVFPKEELEEQMWKLFIEYEKYLQLNNPVFPEIELMNKEKEILQDLPIAIIESINKLHIFKVNLELTKNRKIPTNPQININLNLQLPPSIKPNQLPQETQNILNELMIKIQQYVLQLVQQEIVRQSPIVGYNIKAFGGKWHEIS